VPALRLGTQELVRRGLGPSEMGEVADVIARVLVAGEPPGDVRAGVEALRHRHDGGRVDGARPVGV
jgi:glycine hydroxymethyltransferase